MRQEAAGERERLEADVRQAKEDGSLRIRSLEDSLARLSGRSGEPQVGRVRRGGGTREKRTAFIAQPVLFRSP